MSIETLSQAVMRSVARAGVINDDNIDHAVEIMRAEIKSFLFGDEYANERASVLAGTISEAHVMASVAASCILKISHPGKD